MATLSNLVVKITGDTGGLVSALQTAEKKTGRFTSGFGKHAKTVAKGATVMGGAGLAAGGALVAGASKVAAYGDEVATQADKVGVGTKALQEMNFWASENSINNETLEKSVGRLNQRIGDAADGTGKYAKAFEDVGVKVRDSQGNIRDTESVMKDTISALRDIESPAERGAKAMEIFGTKTARDLMPALADGSLSLEDAAKKANELGLVMGEDAIESASKFQGSWDNIKNSVTGMLRQGMIPVMTFMADKVFPFLEGTAIPALRTFADWLGDKLGSAATELTPKIQKWWGILQTVAGGLREQLGPAVETIVGKLTQFTSWFKNNESAMQALGIAVGTVLVVAFTAWAVAAGAAAVATIAAAAPVIALVAVIGGLAAGIFLLIKHWDTITEKVPILGTAFDTVKGLLSAFGSWITGTLVPTVMEIAQAVMETGQKAIGFVQKHWGTIESVIDKAMAGIKRIVEAIWSEVEIVIDTALGVIEGVIKTVTGVITGDWEKAWEGIKQIFTSVWDGIKGIVENRLKLLKDALSGAWDTIKGVASTAWTTVRDTVTGKVTEMKDNIGTAIDNVVGFFTGLPGRMLGAVGRISEMASAIGNTIKDGIINGIKGFASRAGEIASDIQGALKSAINSALRWLHNNVSISVPGIDPPGPGSIPGFSWNFPLIQLARGGPIAAGQPAIVGEDGPELFVPSRSGRVMSNDSLQPQGGGTPAAGPAGGVTVQVNMPYATINAQDRRQAERAAGTFAWGTVSALRARGVA